MLLSDPSLPWPIPRAAVALIAEREGCRLRAYKCPAGVWTLGYGETDGIAPGMKWTQAQADQRFCDSLTQRTQQVQALLTTYAEPNQLGAMVSLAYNIGIGAFAKSSVLRAHNSGDFAAAARAFAMFNKARINGVLTALAGLTSRRAAEAALYLTPEPGVPSDPMPQAVGEESKIASSPTVLTSSGSMVAGAVGVASQFKEQFSPLADAMAWIKGIAADVFGISPDIAPWLLLAGVGGVVFYRRIKQRAEGVA